MSPTSGIINAVLMKLGVIDKLIFFVSEADMFLPMYLITNLRKTTDYSIVVYLATISGIDEGMYEAAYIDGAKERILLISACPGKWGNYITGWDLSYSDDNGDSWTEYEHGASLWKCKGPLLEKDIKRYTTQSANAC